jgi:hypothetical protein
LPPKNGKGYVPSFSKKLGAKYSGAALSRAATEEKNAIENAISEIVQAVATAKRKTHNSEKNEKCTIS